MAKQAVIAPYLAAVVQAPMLSVASDRPVRETMRLNVERIVAIIDAIMAITQPRPRLLVFPVLCLTGASRKARGVDIASVAVQLPGEELEPVVRACERYDCYFASTTQEKVPQLPGQYFHTGFILGPRGLVLRSPKAQARSAADITILKDCYDEYADVFGEDAVLPVAQTPIGTLGCFVESEALVPEVARRLRQKGADILVHPSLDLPAVGDDAHRPHPYRAVLETIAYANGVYVLSASASRLVTEVDGASSEVWFGGSSYIFGPDGSLLATLGGRSEGIAVAEIDLGLLHTVREHQVPFTTPAPRLYRALYD